MCSYILKAVSISENIFGRQSFYRTDFFKSFHVELLLIAENHVAVRLVCHCFLFKLHDVVHSQ